jgi:hypothetical protein
MTEGMSAVPLGFDHERGLTLKLYERGCALLEQCMTFDETKYWDSLADAAIAWGKIHQSDRVEQLARALKLRAFRRLGELARIERPAVPPRPRLGEKTGGSCGRPPGQRSWLMSKGLDQNAANAAKALAELPPDHFEELTRMRKPPSPASFRGGYSEWQEFYRRSNFATLGKHTRSVMPAAAAKLEGINQHNRAKIQRYARELSNWLQEFAAALEQSI